MRAGVPAGRRKSHQRRSRRGHRPLRRCAGVHRAPGCADPAHRLPADPGHAVCHASPGGEIRGGDPCRCPPGGGAGKCAESHQCGRYFPQRCRTGHGCGFAEPRLQQSPLPPQCPGQYGHGIPGPLDLSGRKLAGTAPQFRLQNLRHGLAG